ncbi:hypothetical protein AVEN_92781-1 [Araneus ventricosus]|uniref:Uncharacterized protein n=1 Tax=Araneus ventricosus TaxID=182803 RepID=A0A4Y2MCM1_ARAVE|nr:hypothetical protein AVEN_92781-1 [Araneus ventricosus]
MQAYVMSSLIFTAGSLLEFLQTEHCHSQPPGYSASCLLEDSQSEHSQYASICHEPSSLLKSLEYSYRLNTHSVSHQVTRLHAFRRFLQSEHLPQ